MQATSLKFIKNPTENDHGAIIEGINNYAAQHGLKPTGGFFYAAYDEQNNIVAAISGFDNFGPTEIGGLWVADAYRKQGIGTALVNKAIEWAKEKGCSAVTVFTLKNWPACNWYQKMGFEVEYERVQHGHRVTGCYLIKKI